jgi:hypothetical protein
MRGFVTDRDLEAAEACFPGIRAFYASLARKPTTFLELVWLYEAARLAHADLAHAA